MQPATSHQDLGITHTQGPQSGPPIDPRLMGLAQPQYPIPPPQTTSTTSSDAPFTARTIYDPETASTRHLLETVHYYRTAIASFHAERDKLWGEMEAKKKNDKKAKCPDERNKRRQLIRRVERWTEKMDAWRKVLAGRGVQA